jgi:ribonuclease HI
LYVLQKEDEESGTVRVESDNEMFILGLLKEYRQQEKDRDRQEVRKGQPGDKGQGQALKEGRDRKKVRNREWAAGERQGQEEFIGEGRQGVKEQGLEGGRGQGRWKREGRG